MAQENCIFCNIASGQIPSATVYEDEDFRCILDIAPAVKGHILVIPKKHIANIYELPEELAGKMLSLVSKVAIAQRITLACDGTNILQNNGTAGWQSIFHLHIHIIPRYTDDHLVLPWKTLSYADGEIEEYAKKIRDALS